jgi:hypothetical protein
MMILFFEHFSEAFDDEEEERDIDDALLGELDDGVLDDEESAREEIDPMMKDSLRGLGSTEGEEGGSEKFFEDDEEEDVDDYDSFDDQDEM